MAKAPKHLHRYEKVQLGKNGYTVFRCNLPGCSHYIRKELAKNKLCECNRCGEPMILDSAAMLLKKPHCAKCIQRKNKEQYESVKEFMELLDKTNPSS